MKTIALSASRGARALAFGGLILSSLQGWALPSSFAERARRSLPADAPERLDDIFRPTQTEHATLSPDGQYVAYSYREGEQLSVVVVDATNPATVKSKVVVATDTTSTPLWGDTWQKTPAAIRWMMWVTPNRLVVETNRNFVFLKKSESGPGASPNGFNNVPGEIVAFDADGSNAQVLVTPQKVSESAYTMVAPQRAPAWRVDQPVKASDTLNTRAFTPLDTALSQEGSESEGVAIGELVSTAARSPRIFDLCADDPESVLVRAEGRRGYELYRLNVVTGKLRSVYEEVINPDLQPLFDRQGKARIAIRASQQTPFPHSFLIAGKGILSRWDDLDRKVGTATAPEFLVSPENFFGERAIPLGFDENPDILYYASNHGRDSYGIYALNVKSGHRTEQVIEHGSLDLITPDPVGYARPGALVYDRYDRHMIGVRYAEAMETTRWLRPDWQALQTFLENTLPGRSVKIMEWDKSAQRFLISARGVSDPGRFLIFDAQKKTLTDFAQRAPWLAENTLSRTYPFAFESTPGVRISGIVTVPTWVRTQPVPLVVMCPDDPWQRVTSDYRPEVQALTDSGFAVAQINLRGAWGFGRKFRDQIKNGYERAQIEDICATTDYLSKHLAIHPRRVALWGRARGAYLALRAAQLNPTRFRCVIAVEPTVDLGSWLDEARWTTDDPGPALTQALWGGRQELKQNPLGYGMDPVTRPVMFVTYPGPRGAPRTRSYLDVRRLGERIKAADTPVERLEVDADYVQGLPKARAAAFRQVQEFLNFYVYAYDVKLGDTKELRD